MTLACELSRVDAPVRWAKEGVRLEAGGSLVLEEEGAHRRLLIPAARAEHSGKYACDAGDDMVTFTVQVSGERGAGALGAGRVDTGHCAPMDMGGCGQSWRGGSSPQHPCCGQPPGTAPHGPDLARGAPGRG